MTAPLVATTAAKAFAAVIGAVLNIVATVATSGALPPQWTAVVTGVIGLLTALGVYSVPNRPK